MARMSAAEVEHFRNLSPKLRRDLALKHGFFRNDYEETLRIAEHHAASLQRIRFFGEMGAIGLDVSDVLRLAA